MLNDFGTPWSVLPAMARIALPQALVLDAQQQAMHSCLLSPQGAVISIDRDHNGSRHRFEFDVASWACVRVLRQAAALPIEERAP